jgi:hypothetical protein
MSIRGHISKGEFHRARRTTIIINIERVGIAYLNQVLPVYDPQLLGGKEAACCCFELGRNVGRARQRSRFSVVDWLTAREGEKRDTRASASELNE